MSFSYLLPAKMDADVRHLFRALFTLLTLLFCNSISAQVSMMVHSGNDTIVISADEIDSVTFSTLDIEPTVHFPKKAEALTREKGTNHSVLDSLLAEMAALRSNIAEMTRTNDSLKAQSEAFDKYITKPSIWMPRYLYGLVNSQIRIYKESLFPMADPDFYNLVSEKSPGNVTNNYYYSYDIKKAKEAVLDIAVKNELVGTIAPDNPSTLVCLNKGVSPATNKNVLVIGDSYTRNHYWVAELQRLITGKVTSMSDNTDSPVIADSLSNITFIGTNGIDSIAKHEGYSGVGYRFFATQSYCKTGGVNRLNPFWNLDDSSVDFDSYCNRFGYDKIDYCIIMLGRNGNDADEYVFAVWNALLRHNPDVKVIVACNYCANPHGTGSSGDYLDITGKASDYERFQSLCEREEYKDNFLFVDFHLQFDALANMPHEAVQTNSQNPESSAVAGTNGVHPSKYGYWQIADIIRPAFHYWFLNGK